MIRQSISFANVPEADVPEAEGDMSADFLETTFIAGRNALEENYPNLFQGANANKSQQWKVSTWSKNIRRENRMRRDD